MEDYYEYNTETGQTNYYEENDYNNYESNIKTLNEKYPLIDWNLYFEKIFEYYDIKVTFNEESIVIDDDGFENVYEIMSKANSKDLINYFEW